MRTTLRFCVTVLPVCMLSAACENTPPPTRPADVLPTEAVTSTSITSTSLRAGGRRVLMLDQCDPESFNAAIEPGACVTRNGGVIFDTFISLLQKHQVVPSWRFSPDTIHVPRDLTLPIVNAGGEVHTFTPVAEFGGGIVPLLNNLSGTPVPAPECLALTSSDFIAAGGQTSHAFEPGQAEKFQCCIHPWMRAQAR